MENGYYRASDTSCSLQDWITLNFSEIPQEVVLRLCGMDITDSLSPVTVSEEPVEPDEPDRDGFDSEEDYEEAPGRFESEHDTWEEEHETWESENYSYDLPMWGTMWLVESTVDLAAALEATGFKVYEVIGGPLEDFSSKSLLLFGVNGAGYGFHGAHWIPLRASLCKNLLQKSWITTEDYRKMIEHLAPLMGREGENKEHFLKDFEVPDPLLNNSAEV